MANEDQYIHPIIQAMISSQQQMFARQQLAQNFQQQQNETAARQQQLKIEQQRADQAEEALDDEHKYHSTMLEQQHQIQQAQMEMMQMSARKQIRDDLLNGTPPEMMTNQGQPGQQVPGGGAIPDTRSINLPNLGLNVPISVLKQAQQSIPAALQSQARGMASAQTQGQLEATEPYKISDEERRANTAKQLKQMDIDYQMKKDQFDKSTLITLQNLRNGPEYQRNQLEYGITPEQQEAGINGFMVGDFLPSSSDLTNPRAARAYAEFKQLGGKALNKEDNQFFDNANRVDGAVKDLLAISQQLPDETKLGSAGAVANARALSALNNSSLSLDLRNKINEMNLNIPAIMRGVQQYPGSRMNTNDMMMIQKGTSNIGTMQQAQDYASKLMEMKNRNIVNAEGGMPKIQQDLLWNNRHVTPSYVIQSRNPQLEQKGYTLDMDRSIAAGKALYDSPSGAQQ